jgi:hypothetical protein
MGDAISASSNFKGRGEYLRRFPRIAYPDISDSVRREIFTLVCDFFWKSALLRLVLVVQDKDAERCFLPFSAGFLRCLRHILLQLPHGIFQGCPCVIHLIDNEDVFAYQIRHFETAQVEPLRTGHLCAWLLDRIGTQGLIEGKTDSLDGNVWAARLLQKRSV